MGGSLGCESRQGKGELRSGLLGVKVVYEEGLGCRQGGNSDCIVTVMTSPLSGGKVIAVVQLHSQLLISLQCFSAASLLQHI